MGAGGAPKRRFDTALEMARSACQRAADRPLVQYFDTTLTGADLDAASDALAVALQERGVAAGDRVAVHLQNVPLFPISVLAAWKAGGIVVPVNPMLRERELTAILADSGASALICADDLYHAVARQVLRRDAGDVAVRTVVTTSALDYLDNAPALLADHVRIPTGDALDLATLVDRHAGHRPRPVDVAAARG